MREYAVHYGCIHGISTRRVGRDRHASGSDESRRRDLLGDCRGSQSLILDQVTNGVAVRMAVLYLLAGGNFERRRSSASEKNRNANRKASHQ